MTPSKPRILVIDDQIGRLASAKKDFVDLIDGHRYDISFCSGQEAGRNSLNVALDAVRSNWPPHATHPFWSLVLLDVQFDSDPASPDDDRFGFAVLAALRREYGAQLPVVMLTRERHETKRGLAARAAADGYLEKEKLGPSTMQDTLELRGYLEDSRPPGQRLVGRSLALLSVLREARLYAKQYAANPRLGSRILYGETGTGKTELAKYIHHWSGRGGEESFRKWTAEGTNEEMVKDKLFGHWKGAHDKAFYSNPGEIEEAHGGTFFVDEIADLSARVQHLLLDFRRQDAKGYRTVSRQGPFPRDRRDAEAAAASVCGTLLPNHEVQVDVLALWATNAQLGDEAVRKKIGFRNDLYRALRPEITLPALNSRREDIPLLFAEFLDVVRQGRRTAVDSAVTDRLLNHDWTDKNIVALGDIAVYAAAALGGDFDEVLPRHLDASGLLDDGGVPQIAVSTQRRNVEHAGEPPSSRSVGTGGALGPLPDQLNALAVPADEEILRGLLPRVQGAYARLLLKLFGAALRATKNVKTGRTSSLDATCLLLGRKKLTPSGKAQTKKAYDVVRRLVAIADTQFSSRGAGECDVLSDDELVKDHVRQALLSRSNNKTNSTGRSKRHQA